MLAVSNLSAGYGSFQALFGVSLEVRAGEAVAVIGGERQKIHFFCLDLPHSDAGFVKAYPAERLEAFLDGLPQLAHGLPVGGELDYLDEGTLAQALRARRPIS